MTKRKIDQLEHLDDYASGTMSEADADVFEEELFAAAAKGDAEDARWHSRFELLMSYFGRGDFLIRGSTQQDIEDARRGGLKVHVIELAEGATVPYTHPADTELIVTAVPCDVRGYESVEATIGNPDGRVLHTFRDCMPEPSTGKLYALCAAPLASKAWGGGPRVVKVTGTKAGKREEIAVYFVRPGEKDVPAKP